MKITEYLNPNQFFMVKKLIAYTDILFLLLNVTCWRPLRMCKRELVAII